MDLLQIFEYNHSSNAAVSSDIDSDCSAGWASPNHALFQIAHVILLLAYLTPNSPRGVLLLHAGLSLGYLLLTTWAWTVLCTPDMLSWSFGFLLINAVQVFFLLYKIRPVQFSPEFEDVYIAMFAPLNITRQQFKKLTAAEMCQTLTLHEGEIYAHEEVTKTDRLGLLLTGRAKVYRGDKLLHDVKARQFFDSPEFQANSKTEERFHVSIVSSTPCRYILWLRHNLEYLFSQEPHIATVTNHLLARDITDKLYQMNDQLPTVRGQRLDIRLPSISSAAMSGLDISRLKMKLALNGSESRASSGLKDVEEMVRSDSGSASMMAISVSDTHDERDIESGLEDSEMTSLVNPGKMKTSHINSNSSVLIEN